MPPAVEKAVKDGSRNMVSIHMEGTSIPHTIQGRFGAAHVILVPASPGTGVIAGSAVRAVCEAAGIRDILTEELRLEQPDQSGEGRHRRPEGASFPGRRRAAAGSFALMNLNDVNRGVHKNKSRKRLGPRSGLGPGQDRRPRPQGAKVPRRLLLPSTFEGGQMPLVRRVPKRGFHNKFGLLVAVVNLDDLEARFQAGEEVNAETLKAKNLLKGRYRPAEDPRRRRSFRRI